MSGVIPAVGAISDAELERRTGVPARVIVAIRSVESRQIWSATRFEPHVFWRRHLGLPETLTGRQIRAKLSVVQLSQVPYTPGPSGAASHLIAETNRLATNRAMKIDADVGVRATSWGAYQDLGAALLAVAGGGVPVEAVKAFDENPQRISGLLFVEWCKHRPHFAEIARSLDFEKIAHAYNGCTDCTHYAGRLRAAYNAAAPATR